MVVGAEASADSGRISMSIWIQKSPVASKMHGTIMGGVWIVMQVAMAAITVIWIYENAKGLVSQSSERNAEHVF